MFRRHLTPVLTEALVETPILLLQGSCQVGKSTLVKELLETVPPYDYSLEDPSFLLKVSKDPLFLQNLSAPVVIEEMQRAPSLLFLLKDIVDQGYKSGSFVLTSSADILSRPRLKDALAGRIKTYTLWPLSQGEINHRQEDFISFIFKAPSLPSYPSSFSLEALEERILQGGYPDIVDHSHQRQTWFASYLPTIFEKDRGALGAIQRPADLLPLLQVCAARIGRLLNTRDLARLTRIPTTTLKRYLLLLQHLYLLVLLPAWTKNLRKRVVKKPQLYLNDTGLLLYLRNFDKGEFLKEKVFFEKVVKNFVVMELKKQLGWSQEACRLYHYRTHTQQDIAIILEAPDSRLVALDIKLSPSVEIQDFTAIKALEEDIGPAFHRGIVLYTGKRALSWGPNKWALPLSFLWDHPPKEKTLRDRQLNVKKLAMRL